MSLPMIVRRKSEPRTPMLKPTYTHARPLISTQRVAEIVNEIAAEHKVHPNYILGTRREARIVAARHAYIAAFMREYNLTLSHATQYLQLDRDTIRNALKMNLRREVENDLLLRGLL